jgi:hypothetical protein
MSLPSSTRSQVSSKSRQNIHESLYNRSLSQQEEGKKRRQQVEAKLFKSRSFDGNFHRKQEKEGAFREEMFKSKKKITVDQAQHLYERLVSHKTRAEERTKILRREREERETEWLRKQSERKISLEKAVKIYYRQTATSRSRSRGRMNMGLSPSLTL